jgi:hypothetical protein
MCDYSLSHVRSRPARVGEKLRTTDFGTGTRGFASVEDPSTAVCVLPGTELAFDLPLRVYGQDQLTADRTAIFRQLDKELPYRHHDALELPDGRKYLLTLFWAGQQATVLQLPAAPATEAEAKSQERAAYAG